jgi:cell division protein FtsQ
MDGAGCLAEPLSGPSRPTASATATARRAPARRRGFASVREILRRAGRLGALGRRLNARMEKFDALRPPRGFGLAGAALIIFGSIVFGAIRGGHIDEIVESLRNARDTAANAAGFNITGVALAGHKHLTREEIFAIAGVTGHSSLLFLDVADARARLKTNPWIADATVQKLYPDRLQITITERAAFALWQKGGRIGVIADDGTVLEPYISRNVAGLPLFVGDGAATRAKDFLTLLERYPDLREQLRASVLVAERRWNLRLKNGVDVRLPEFDVARALDQLVGLDRDKKILSRDIVSIDLRLPDRVTLRLSEAAAQAREEALKAKKPKPKGGNA